LVFGGREGRVEQLAHIFLNVIKNVKQYGVEEEKFERKINN